MQTLPSPGRAAFLIGTTVPTVIPSGDAQFNRQQDQTNASLLSLGGGTRRGNNYTLDGVPITDLRNRATANPSIESLEDVKVQVHTYDAEMGRTGGGVFNTTLRVGRQQPARHRLRPDPPDLGPDQQLLQREGRARASRTARTTSAAAASAGRSLRNRTFFWFSTESYHDVQTRNASVTMPTALERAGDFSQTTTPPAQLVVIYDPLTGQPFAGNRIPSSRINPTAAAMLQYLPLRRRGASNGIDQLHAHVAHQEPVPAALLGQGVAQADRHDHAHAASISTTRPTSPTPTTSAPPTSPSRRGSPIRSTTSWCGGRRSSRSTTPG